MASCCHHSCRGPGFPPLMAGPAGGSLPWGHSLPLCRALCHLPGPKASTWCWWPRVGWGGELAGPGNTHLRPHPHQPTYLHPGARFMAGAGQSLGTERYKCSGAHLRLMLHLHTRPAHTLPTADTTENLTLGGWEGWRGGNAGSYVSPHLLFKGTYSSSKKETYIPPGHPRGASCAPSQCPTHRNGGGGAESTLGDKARRGRGLLQGPPLSSPSLMSTRRGRG